MTFAVDWALRSTYLELISLSALSVAFGVRGQGVKPSFSVRQRTEQASLRESYIYWVCLIPRQNGS